MIRNLLLYVTVFVACFFEGETALITSAFAAHRGYLEIFGVMIAALTATQSWDWLWFTVGRKRGALFLSNKPKLKEKAGKIDLLLMKHPILVLLGYRFMFGFRTAVPLVIGMSSVRIRKFLYFSLINAVIWDILYSSVGYFFGAILKANWKRIEDYEFEIMFSIAVIGIMTGLIIKFRSRKGISKKISEIEVEK
jgi:membrane protein DedA with SNARE-associated domain